MIKPATFNVAYNLKFMFASIDTDNIAKLKIILHFTTPAHSGTLVRFSFLPRVKRDR